MATIDITEKVLDGALCLALMQLGGNDPAAARSIGDVVDSARARQGRVFVAHENAELRSAALLTPKSVPSTARDLHVLVDEDSQDATALVRQLVSTVRQSLAGAIESPSGAIEWWTTVSGTDSIAARTAHQMGLRQMRTVLRLHLDLNGRRAVAAAEARPFRLSDTAAILEINNAAFYDHPDRANWNKSQIEQELRSLGGHLEDLIVTPPAGEPVAFCWTKRPTATETAGEIYVLAAHPERKSFGLGAALLASGLDHLANSVKVQEAFLYVEANNTKARRLYDQFGFKDAEQTLLAFEFASGD